MACKLHFSVLLLLSFFLFSTHSRVDLHHSDLKAISTIQKQLGITGQRSPSATPCNNPGVFCERRLTQNNTYVLKITRLIFKSQRLNGFLSPAVGRLSDLKELSVPNNQLVDWIPHQIVDCKKLEILDLGNNRFSGEIPSELSKLVRLRVLDLSNNKLAGNLSFLKQFPNLEHLSLANNLFTGIVPKSLRSFRNLQFFDLSGNSFLDGDFPVMNKAESESESESYPKRYILAETNSTTSKSKANTSIASATASAPSALAPSPSAGTSGHKSKKGKRKAVGWILGFLAGAVAGSISGFVFSVMFKLALATIRGGGKDSGPAIFSPHVIKKAEYLAFLEKEDGIANLEMIGKGGCGEVYRAVLPESNGKMIAIKKIIQPPKEAAEISEEDSKAMGKKMRQIRSEINTVGQIRHRNLLPLLAHVSRPDCHYLVYEYMKNGSLQDMLNEVQQGKRELDWPTRHRIALGVASGIEYLHMSHSPKIIHRDLKPANILLDDDMEARIADFGLAKAMPDAHTHISTSNVAGTVGYIAPELYQTLKFTEQCDIYSYGVVLGVLMTGMSPSDDFLQSTREMSLIKWMRNVITSENPTQAIDPKLMGNGYDEQVLLVLKIACFCTKDDPKERPNSKDIRCMLSQIKF